MPQVPEELRQHAIIELEAFEKNIQDIRYALLFKTLSPETIDEELKITFQHIFELNQRLRAVRGEDWPYPQSSQYRNYDPRFVSNRADIDPNDHLNDLPHPPRDDEVESENQRPGP